MKHKPRVLFIGSTYAGHKTRFLNLVDFMEREATFDREFVSVSGWEEGGFIEGLPGIPRGLKGRARALWQARAFARMPRPDVIWTSAGDLLPPYIWSQLGPLHTNLIQDLDATMDQIEAMSKHYFDREPSNGVRRKAKRMAERQSLRATTVATPWSHWAAHGLRDLGLPASRIRVIPPGVDLTRWRPDSCRGSNVADPLRLLFVGGDFRRKGGDILLRLLAGPLRDRVVIDIVTHERLANIAGVNVHQATPNSLKLMDLYRGADLFVLPTRAECFGIATIEALASGLPVLTTKIGGAADIVEPDVGWLTEPTDAAVLEKLEHILANRTQLGSMARHARALAEQRFDANKNHGRLVALISSLTRTR